MLPTRRALLATSLGLASLVTLDAGSALAAPRSRRLFVITRSLNANTVHYDLKLKGDGSIDADDPVGVYWVMEAEDGHREGLTWLERQFAYGHTVVGVVGARGFRMRLAAFGARDIVVERAPSASYRAVVTIAGRRALLERIHVQAEGAKSARWVNVIGRLDTGERVTERLKA